MTGTDLGGYGAIEQYVNDIGSPLPVFKDHPPNSAIPESLGGLVYLIDQGDGLEVWSRSRGEDPVRLGGGGSGGSGSSAWSENAEGVLEPNNGQPVSVEKVIIDGTGPIREVGQIDFGSVSSGSSATKTVTFSDSYATAPNILFNYGGTEGAFLATSPPSNGASIDITTSGFTAIVYNGSGGSRQIDKCGYIVIES